MKRDGCECLKTEMEGTAVKSGGEGKGGHEREGVTRTVPLSSRGTSTLSSLITWWAASVPSWIMAHGRPVGEAAWEGEK